MFNGSKARQGLASQAGRSSLPVATITWMAARRIPELFNGNLLRSFSGVGVDSRREIPAS